MASVIQLFLSNIYVGILLALGMLVRYHCSLISNGETCIEVLSNKDQQEKLKLKGQARRSLWQWPLISMLTPISNRCSIILMITGVARTGGKSWGLPREGRLQKTKVCLIRKVTTESRWINRTWWHITFPSSHPPCGDGISWTNGCV